MAQEKHDYAGTAKGPALKIGLNHKLIKFIEDKIINEKYSPSAALAAARAAEDIEVNFCEKTFNKGLAPSFNVARCGFAALCSVENSSPTEQRCPRLRGGDILPKLYNYIDQRLFPNLTNDDLPVKKIGHKRNYRHVRAAVNPKGKSIEERPVEAENRESFGHWELDTVVGKQGTKAALMALT